MVFSIVFGCVIIFTSTQESVRKAEQTTAGALTLYGGKFQYGSGGEGWRSPPIEDAELFVDSDYVETYNLGVQAMSTAVVSEGMEIYIRNPELVAQNSQYVSEEEFENYGKEHIYGVTNSEMCEAFSVYGYTLAAGDPITTADKGKPSLIISEEYAELNHLTIGDSITFHGSSYYGMDPEKIGKKTFTVTGIFAAPSQDGVVYPFLTEDPANYMFAETYYLLDWLQDEEVAWATVYLKNASDVEAFLNETAQKLDVCNITGRFNASEDYITAIDAGITKEEMQGELHENRWENWDEHHFYTVQWDKDWFEMVAKPTESVRDLSVILALALLGGAILVLILICVLNVCGRTKEYGLLLSLGEDKKKVAAQAMLETLLPLIAALVFGLALSVTVTAPMLETYSKNLLESRAEETQEENRALTGTLAQEQNATDTSVLQSRQNSGVKANSSVDFKADAGALAVCAAAILVLVLLVLLVQMAAVLRLRPAVILRQRK